MTALQAVVSLSTAGVIVAVVGEAAWLRLGLDRRDLGLTTAALMAFGATPAAALLARVDEHLWPAIGVWSPAALRDLWHDHPALGVVVAFVAWDAAGYWYHRLGHGTSVGWAAHGVHHSGTRYDMTLAWRQSWFPLHAVVAFPPVALTGVDLTTVLGCAAVSKLWQALVHTSLPVRLPRPIAAVVMTPATHRRHHLVDGGANYGPMLTVWDRLAGTWDPEPVPHDAPVGLPSGAATAADTTGRRPDRGALRIETEGWVALVRRARRPYPSLLRARPSRPRVRGNRPATPTGADYG